MIDMMDDDCDIDGFPLKDNEENKGKQGCKYCLEMCDLEDLSDIEPSLYIEGNILVALRYDEADSRAEINYCPKCGRVLNEQPDKPLTLEQIKQLKYDTIVYLLHRNKRGKIFIEPIRIRSVITTGIVFEVFGSDVGGKLPIPSLKDEYYEYIVYATMPKGRNFYIQQIKAGLEKLVPACTAVFNRMYPDGLEKIPDDKLACAFQQVNCSLEKAHLIKAEEVE